MPELQSPSTTAKDRTILGRSMRCCHMQQPATLEGAFTTASRAGSSTVPPRYSMRHPVRSFLFRVRIKQGREKNAILGTKRGKFSVPRKKSRRREKDMRRASLLRARGIASVENARLSTTSLSTRYRFQYEIEKRPTVLLTSTRNTGFVLTPSPWNR